VTRSLVFVTGASGGIGRAVARAVPFDARVLDLSRSPGDAGEPVATDLATAPGWQTARETFAREIASGDWARIVLVHCAGTLDPIGYAGEVDPDAYRRSVLLNAAAPQILGEAFLAALSARRLRVRAPAAREPEAHLMLLSSGAASRVYEGWSAYCAGKAAVEHWVRTVAAEQATRGSGCRVIAVAPGVVQTAMQDQIRATPERDFPSVERFRDLHEAGELRSPETVARELWGLLERNLENGAVIDLRDLAG
jgi:benzil reductase ((S)-benzoin forming)